MQEVANCDYLNHVTRLAVGWYMCELSQVRIAGRFSCSSHSVATERSITPAHYTSAMLGITKLYELTLITTQLQSLQQS